MKELKNINHSFDIKVGDVGCTIRKGRRWSDAPTGELLYLMNCWKGHTGTCTNPCVKEGEGRVLGSWVGELKDLPPNLLNIEHNNEARNMNILKEMLRVGYGSISDNDIITALIYERLK